MTAEERKEFSRNCIQAVTQMVKENESDNDEWYFSTMEYCEATPEDYANVSDPIYQTLTVSKDSFDWQNDFHCTANASLKPRVALVTTGIIGEKTRNFLDSRTST